MFESEIAKSNIFQSRKINLKAVNAKGLAAGTPRKSTSNCCCLCQRPTVKCTVETFVDMAEKTSQQEQGKFIMRINLICL